MEITLFVGLFLFNQYFGQNKIQYKDFDFKILSTEHFDIYFYPGGENLAVFAEDVLEDGYHTLSRDLGVEVEFKVPVILYNSPNDFSQTNVTLELIEESVGGFTEILKNRMVIPFTGDYEELRHVLVHELTHVFEFVIFFPSKLEAILTGDFMYSIPLWVMEGLAEFESQNWNFEADIYIRDLIMNNKAIPLTQLEGYGGYIIYKEGQAFFYYIEQKYGREKVGEFIHLLKAKKNLEASFLSAFGIGVEEFNNRWVKFFQVKYWPKIVLTEYFDSFARIVYDHKKTNSYYNTSAAISPRGDRIAFISDRQGTAELIIISSIDGRILKKLVRAEYSPGYEGLHLYQGGITWSPDEKYLSFAAKASGRDVLYIINVRNGRVWRKFKFDLDGIYSPKFTPDGKKIIFSGLKDSYLDVYLLEIASGNIERITNDIYVDKYPVVADDGRIAFVSDRPDSSEEYRYGDFALFIKEDSIYRLTPRTNYVASPFFSSDTGIFFVADYDSAYNLYYYSFSVSQIIKQTKVLTGIYYPSISREGNKIAFCYYNNYGYDVCVVKEPLDKMEAYEGGGESVGENSFEEAALKDERVRKYHPKFTLDYIVASASYYTPLGFSGMTEIALSDILGNHYIQFSTDFYGSLTTSDIFLNYWYLKKRTDFGFAIFQYLNYFAESYDLLVWRYLGSGAIAQYPFSKFFRAEFGLYAYKIYETRWYDFFPDYISYYYSDTSYNFIYPEVSLIFDNTKWGETGPHNGLRARITYYNTIFSDFDVKVSILDYRRYFNLSPRANFALRLVLAGNFGQDKELWSIGGAGTIRGFDYYTFTGSDLGFLNFEYRFPFIDRLKLAFPLPIEIKNIRGVLFTDWAGIYSDSFQVYESAQGFPPFKLKDLKLGVGGGLRFTLLFIIFKLDAGRAFDLHNWIDENGKTSHWKFYLTIGPEW
uniref:Bacterial surface antigen (D15) domain-containing protein n=1 Tax=candidate division WOR-3 bacterium TaxID=2052148 RepID=A0A7C4TDM4_UNCW3